MSAIWEPGTLVRHPLCPEWGLGQVQSNINDRLTVNFEHAGKVVLDLRVVTLEMVFPT
jgi:hypothetical protein